MQQIEDVVIILSGGRSIDVMKARGGVSGCLK